MGLQLFDFMFDCWPLSVYVNKCACISLILCLTVDPCQCMLTSVICSYIICLCVICSYIICLCVICLCKYEELYTICDIVISQSSTIGACDLMTCYIHPVYVYETRISSHSEFLHIQNRYKSFNNNTQSINNNNLFKMQTRLYCTPKCQNMKRLWKRPKVWTHEKSYSWKGQKCENMK